MKRWQGRARRLQLRLLWASWVELVYVGITTVGLGSLWCIAHWQAGHAGWATVFAVIVAMGIGFIATSLVLKTRERMTSSGPIRPPGLFEIAREARREGVEHPLLLTFIAWLTIALAIAFPVAMAVTLRTWWR